MLRAKKIWNEKRQREIANIHKTARIVNRIQ